MKLTLDGRGIQLPSTVPEQVGNERKDVAGVARLRVNYIVPSLQAMERENRPMPRAPVCKIVSRDAWAAEHSHLPSTRLGSHKNLINRNQTSRWPSRVFGLNSREFSYDYSSDRNLSIRSRISRLDFSLDFNL